MTPTDSVRQQSPAEAKIALFRSLFRGRDDVYPRRFENRRTGKSGYAPACGNEWVRGICEKPRIKCLECQHRRFLAVTDEVIRWHLSGEDDRGQTFVAGVYPLLLDETCYFLAIDFDKEGWQEDARAFLQTCREMAVPAALERSRSGRGGHVWLFFAEAVPAGLARKLGSSILTETMERQPDVGFGASWESASLFSRRMATNPGRYLHPAGRRSRSLQHQVADYGQVVVDECAVWPGSAPRQREGAGGDAAVQSLGDCPAHPVSADSRS